MRPKPVSLWFGLQLSLLLLVLLLSRYGHWLGLDGLVDPISISCHSFRPQAEVDLPLRHAPRPCPYRFFLSGSLFEDPY